ncbi:MAG TPA: PIN domain-containing protein [Spirochaetes bacterium]|nr:PIN domain-containing protein [Spirochaetota bacterium]
MNWVLDCSFSAALFLPDEFSPKVRDFFANLSENDKLYVPLIWWYEITNVLIVAERKNRLNYVEVVKVTLLFEQLGIETDNTNGVPFSKEIYRLANLKKLSAYDAGYLELAIRQEATLASLDKQLLNAAVNSGVVIYEF